DSAEHDEDGGCDEASDLEELAHDPTPFRTVVLSCGAVSGGAAPTPSGLLPNGRRGNPLGRGGRLGRPAPLGYLGRVIAVLACVGTGAQTRVLHLLPQMARSLGEAR